MTGNAPPSHDAASEDSLAGLMFESYKKFLQSTGDMLPACVVDYDRATNRAHIQPMIMMLTTSGERVTRQGVVSIPVFQMGGGGFLMSFNLVPGDLGWIKATDRDMSLFLQNYTETEPNTKRLHSFNDAMFFPDVMRGYTIDGEDAGNLVIQNMAGTVKISLWPSKIKIVAPTVEIVTTALNVTGATNITGATAITGATTVTGTLNATGTIESAASLKVAGVTLNVP